MMAQARWGQGSKGAPITQHRRAKKGQGRNTKKSWSRHACLGRKHSAAARMLALLDKAHSTERPWAAPGGSERSLSSTRGISAPSRSSGCYSAVQTSLVMAGNTEGGQRATAATALLSAPRQEPVAILGPIAACAHPVTKQQCWWVPSGGGPASPAREVLMQRG